jgi:DNA processing protein
MDEKDILLSLGIIETDGNEKEKKHKKNKKTLETDEKLVYDCIYCEPITVDEISVKTGIDVSSLQYILTMLELQGYVTKLAGTKYIRED